MDHPAKKPTVVVVSSHVAEGAVGNRAAVFALERLGFPVIAVPTVFLSWHPGEGPATRIVPPDDAFAALVDDLIGAPWLDTVGGVLSGYLGAPAQATAVAALVGAAKRRNPTARYLCDPVTGDAGGAYVAEEIIAAIGKKLLPLADMATPNRFELGLVLGQHIADGEALVAAARQTGIAEVVVTSAFAEPGEAANLLVAPEGAYRARHAAASHAPHGTGDLLAALYLGHRLDGRPAPGAFGRAVGSTLHLVAMAGGATRLPLAEGQAALVEPDRAVPVETIG
jgi:pyridoxine kinase